MRVLFTAVAAVGVTCGAAFADVPANPTYAKDVAPIMFENCTDCHRVGQIGPMSLLTYQEVRPWAKSIGKYVGDRAMPPWDADHGYGPWKDDRSLSQDEIDTIVNWVNTGAPRGNPKDLPAAPVYGESAWTLGEPDYVIEFDNYDVAAGGPDQFHDFNVQTELSEDKWITKVEILPGASEVVHHVILWKGDRGDSNPTGWIGAWAAGADPMQFHEGTGRMLQKGAVVRGDFHYHPAEESYTDKTQVGFHFSKSEVTKELVNLWVMNSEFAIPAGASNHEVKSRYTFAEDSHLISLAPHMHYRGKDFVYTATYPDGREKELLKVSDYDFNWQTAYIFENPEAMPKGTRIDCVAHFDNSEGNEANPDPTKTLYFGPESYDEMMIGFIDYIVDEGVSPSAKVDPIVQKIENLLEMHPGNVYSLNVPVDPSKGPQLTALLLPKEGDGGWYVPIGSFAARALVKDIVWNGNDFTATAVLPGQGGMELKGTVNPAAGEITVIMQGLSVKGTIEQ
ncbi:MAG TPA: hypothetical protein EYN96_10210 [Candidatus Hydrogenedentes bacterium]|nr:hypothetical protein [Candidatus Hydrogenedentota bacterium]